MNGYLRIYNDVKGVLRAFYKKNVLEKEEIRDLVEAIEERDNTRVKDFEAVFEEERGISSGCASRVSFLLIYETGMFLYIE